MRKVTLCLLLKDNKILLAMKKRGFGEGKLNGIGGKVGLEETIEEAAVRELEEEVGIVINQEYLENVGNIKFYFKNKPEYNQHMYVFFCKNWQGEPIETEEMRPEWHHQQNIPFDKMWIDDIHWIPLVLAGKKISGEFHFNDDGSEIEKFDIKKV